MAVDPESLGAGRGGVNDRPRGPVALYPARRPGHPGSAANPPGSGPGSERPRERGERRAEERRAERVGIFGGSFDPVHAGHLFVARCAREAFELDRVLFVPAARPPHKPGVRLACAEHRLAMLRIATADEPAFEVRDLELSREGPSYTIDTVRELAAEIPGAELFLVIGEDNLPGLPDWREVEALLRHVRPVVVRRGTGGESALEALATRLSPQALRRLACGWLDVPPHPASSTELRARLGRGEDPGDLLPPGVARYALEHGLYRMPGRDAGNQEAR